MGPQKIQIVLRTEIEVEISFKNKIWRRVKRRNLNWRLTTYLL